MEINDELKSALLADVENICEINLTEKQKTALARCFEITIGTRQGMVLTDAMCLKCSLASCGTCAIYQAKSTLTIITK